jgi:hypothetical protein
MAKRRREEDIAGVLEFQGLTSEDPELADWLADHRSRNGGKVRVSQGGKGIRVTFAKEADMAFWRARSEQPALRKKFPIL